jgi:nanoRNase/pAp phosphatase (c-di-AMP/oligoRNAs hydrolase)
MKDLVESLPNSVFRNGFSGSYLAHEYFFPNKEIPKLIKYISIGDTYTWGQEKYEQEILNYINTSDFDFKIFAKLEKDLEDNNKFKEIKNTGELLQKIKSRQIDTQVKYSKIIDWEGYRVAVLNSTTLSSEIGNRLCEDKKVDFAMIYRFSNNELRFSLRGKGKVNLIELVKKYNGGGHFNAVGFRTNNEKFIKNFLKKIIS